MEENPDITSFQKYVNRSTVGQTFKIGKIHD
jgi:hypothetical protein